MILNTEAEYALSLHIANIIFQIKRPMKNLRKFSFRSIFRASMTAIRKVHNRTHGSSLDELMNREENKIEWSMKYKFLTHFQFS